MPSPAPSPLPDFWPHRQDIAATKASDILRTVGRAQLHWFCGTGKTRLAIATARKLGARRVCVVAPALALVYHHLTEWGEHWTEMPRWAFCSELMSSADGQDIAASTSREDARAFLNQSEGVVFTTYHSLRELAPLATQNFDLLILDEAHCTCGKNGHAFGFGLDPAFPARHRLSLTATPKYLSEDEASDNFSMGDEAVYGPVADVLPYREAQQNGLLCDYRLVVADLGESSLATANQRLWRMAAEMLSLMKDHGLRRAISCHSRVIDAQAFQRILRKMAPGRNICHVNGEMSAREQLAEIDSFRGADHSIITNVQCLNQGINVPAVDLVFFADPKHTDIGIVQAIGRALRRDPDRPGKVACVGLPLHGHATHEFAKLRHVLRTLGFADQRVQAWLETRPAKAAGEDFGSQAPSWISVRTAEAKHWKNVLKRAQPRMTFLTKIDPEAFARAVRAQGRGGSRARPMEADYARIFYDMQSDSVRSFPSVAGNYLPLRKVLGPTAIFGDLADPKVREAMRRRKLTLSRLEDLTGIGSRRLTRLIFSRTFLISPLEQELLQRVLGLTSVRWRTFTAPPPDTPIENGLFLNPKSCRDDGARGRIKWLRACCSAYGVTRSCLSTLRVCPEDARSFARFVSRGHLARFALTQEREYWLRRYLGHTGTPARLVFKRAGLRAMTAMEVLARVDSYFWPFVRNLPAAPGFREPIPGGEGDPMPNQTELGPEMPSDGPSGVEQMIKDEHVLTLDRVLAQCASPAERVVLGFMTGYGAPATAATDYLDDLILRSQASTERVLERRRPGAGLRKMVELEPFQPTW